jgi:uncharacterized protein (DUF736 family)
MTYDNTNTGVLFKNEKSNEKAPDYKGKIDIDGTEYNLAGWIRQSQRTGDKFLSLKIDTYQQQANTDATPRVAPMNDDEIPF